MTQLSSSNVRLNSPRFVEERGFNLFLLRTEDTETSRKDYCRSGSSRTGRLSARETNVDPESTVFRTLVTLQKGNTGVSQRVNLCLERIEFH